MGNSPDVRVRLSAEGQLEVVNAFKRIQQESEKTGRVGSRALDALGASASRLAALLPTLTFAGAIAGAVLLAKRSLEAADNFSKLSQRTGISVETLSSYAHGAELADVEIEDLAKALARLSRAMGEAASGGKQQLEAFRRVGITQKELQAGTITLDQALERIADHLAGLPDGWQKSADAQEFFGRTGDRLLPFLRGGAAGVAAYRAEAERLNLVLSTDAARAAEAFNDNVTRLNGALKGAANVVLAEVGPALVAGSARLVEIAKNTETFRGTARGLGQVLVFLAQVAVAAFEPFQFLGILVGGAGAALEKFVVRDWRGLGLAVEETKRALAEAHGVTTALITAMGSGAAAAQAGFSNVAGAVETRLTPALKKAKKGAADWIAGAGDVGLRQLDALIEKNRELAREVDATLQKGKVGMEMAEPSVERAEENYEHLQDQIHAVGLEMKRTQEAQAQFADLLASSFASALSGATSFRDALRGLLQTIGYVIIRALILRAIMAILPAGWGKFLGFAGGGEVATGGGGVVNVARGGLLHFPRGGLVRGPGTSTSDSIPARLSDGEFVVNARAVKQPGILEFLQDLNSFQTMHIRPIRHVHSYAEGGLVDGDSGTGRIAGLRGELTLDDSLIWKHLESSGFDRLLVKKIGDNKRRIRQTLG